jgi:hypothetical protein
MQHGGNFVDRNSEALNQLADVYSKVTDSGAMDDELLEGIESLNENVPPSANMASLFNKAFDGPLSSIKTILARIDNFHSASLQIAEEANMVAGATLAKGFSIPYNGADGPTMRLSSIEFDVGVQVGMSKGVVLGFWKNRSDELAGEGYFYSISGSFKVGVGLVIYYDTKWNFQGIVVGPVTGASVEASVGWSTNVHEILDYSHGAIHVAGKGLDFLDNVGHEVSTFVDKIINGKKMSRDLHPGEGYLSVFNQAGYVTKIQLWYKMAGQQKYFTRDTTAGFTTEMYVPRGARDIRLLVTGIATIDKENLDKHFDTVAGIKKAYKAYGTIFNVKFTEISPT